MKPKTLKATHQGELDLNGFDISCAVLEDGTRVLVNRSLANAFGIKGSGSYWLKKKDEKGASLPEYLSAQYLQKFIDPDLAIKISESIPYENKQGVLTEGVRADLLPDICNIYVKAGQKGALKNNPEIAETAYKIILAFSKVGITALVDEVTGYQYDREKRELQAILKTLISDEIMEWQKAFHLSFYKEIFRLWDIPFTEENIKHKPQFIGHLTNKFIYENMPKGMFVLQKLKDKTPKTKGGNYRYKLHQSLTPEAGREALKKVIYSVEALASVAEDKRKFIRLINDKYGQKEIPFEDLEEITPEQRDRNSISFGDALSKIGKAGKPIE